MTFDATTPTGSVQPAPRKLYLSRSNRWIGGVCGGLAEYFGWDATIVRALFVVSILLPGPQVLLYLVMWLIIPARPAA